MCGIFGYVGFPEKAASGLDTIAHRGPDDYGEYSDKANQLFLGHRRLSILDLSRAGRQPMALDDIYITFNGEVYNYQDIKAQHFEDVAFRSSTDTEVLLHAYRKFGTRSPELLRGMFAFAIYDKAKNRLILCRDRIGIKPLYYYQKDGRFAFASELAPLKQLPGVDLKLDPLGLDYYFTYGYIPAPFSVYKYIKKLSAAHVLTYDITTRAIRTLEPYWQLKNNLDKSNSYSEEDWIDIFEEKIKEATRLRLISDVPVGAFLSGGLDSSLVVSLMSGLLTQPVKSFTIGFDFQEIDERKYAESVADQYNTDHFVEVVKPDALGILPKLIDSFGEPFSDPAAIPMSYLAEMARKNVTVVLSGDGGDEVFAGYWRYERMHKYKYLSAIPLPMRKLIRHFGKYLPQNIPGYGFLQRQALENIPLYQTMNACMLPDDQAQLYNNDFKENLLRDEKIYYEKIIEEQNGFSDEFITQLQLIDLYSYLPECILTKVDRMSMLHSLEARVPLIDHELVELAFSCPASIRFKGKTLKHITKTILQNKISPEVLGHKKQGFSVPLGQWFRKEWKGFMSALIDETRDDPFINHHYVSDLFQLHQRGGRDFSFNLYTILFYKYWLKRNT